MKPLTAVIAMAGLVLLFVSGLLVQRCSFDRQLAQQQAAVTKSDAQLVTTTEELSAEHIEAAKTEAKETRIKAAVSAKAEAHDESARGDLADFLGERIDRSGGDGSAAPSASRP